MTVRLYQPTDDAAELLATLRQKALFENEPMQATKLEAMYRRCLPSSLRRFRVAKLDGDHAGFFSVLFNRDEAMIGDLYVDPRFWRSGVGTGMFDEAMVLTRRQGYKEISWTSELAATEFFDKVSKPYGATVKGGIDFTCKTTRVRRPLAPRPGDA